MNAQLEEQIDVEPDRPRFVQSKWETVDPEDVESQAMTTSKWDTLIDDEENDDEDVDGDPIDACSDLASTSNTTNTTTTAKGGCFEERGLDLNKVSERLASIRTIFIYLYFNVIISLSLRNSSKNCSMKYISL